MVFSTFDMDQLGKIYQHHWKLLQLLSLRVIHLMQVNM